MPFLVLDADGQQQSLSTTVDANNYLVGASSITDPSTGAKAQVAAFHSSDGQTPGSVAGIMTGDISLLFNGTSLDRRRGNLDTSLVTLSGTSASGNTADQTNYNGRGLQLGVNITAISGTSPTLQVTVQGKDVASGVYYTLLQSASLTTTGFTQMTVYPGAPATSNVSSPQVLPRTYRIAYTIGGSGPSVSATIGASIIV